MTNSRTLSMIVAMTQQGVIGKNNALPWSLPSDLKRFRKITMGHPIIMGRKTFESIGKALPGRRNIVISRQSSLNVPEGVEVVQSLHQAIENCSEAPEIFIIGGSQIFQEALPHCRKIYLTLISKNFDGDIIFPNHKNYLNEFKIINEEKIESNDTEPFAYSFINYERR